jgi:hypothetical protein
LALTPEKDRRDHNHHSLDAEQGPPEAEEYHRADTRAGTWRQRELEPAILSGQQTIRDAKPENHRHKDGDIEH